MLSTRPFLKSAVVATVGRSPSASEDGQFLGEPGQQLGGPFADDQGVYLSLNVNIEGGVTRANIEDTLQLWEQALTDFADYIGWR